MQMFGFSLGPQPDRKVIEDRPDGVSIEAAVHAWSAGYTDARTGRDYYIFPDDSADLQPLYSDGFERGERDKLHLARITERVPKEEGEENSAASSRPRPAIRAEPARVVGLLSRQIKANFEVLVLLSALGLIAAVVWR